MAWPCVAASGSASVIIINHLIADCSRWTNYEVYRKILTNPDKCLQKCRRVHLLSANILFNWSSQPCNLSTGIQVFLKTFIIPAFLKINKLINIPPHEHKLLLKNNGKCMCIERWRRSDAENPPKSSKAYSFIFSNCFNLGLNCSKVKIGKREDSYVWIDEVKVTLGRSYP